MPVDLAALVPPIPTTARRVERRLSDLQQSLVSLGTTLRARRSRIGALLDRLRG
jgi:hypothetical protein